MQSNFSKSNIQSSRSNLIESEGNKSLPHMHALLCATENRAALFRSRTIASLALRPMLSGKVQAPTHKNSPRWVAWHQFVKLTKIEKIKSKNPKLTRKTSTNSGNILSHLVGTQQSRWAACILSDLVGTPAPLRLVRALNQPLSVLKSRPRPTNPAVCAAFCCRLDRRPIRDWEFSVSVTARDCSYVTGCLLGIRQGRGTPWPRRHCPKYTFR
jgi:hypothetical protein